MENNDYVIISAIKDGNAEYFKQSFEGIDMFIRQLLDKDNIVISEKYREYKNNGDICKLGLGVYILRIVDYSSIPLAYDLIRMSRKDIFGGSRKLYNCHSFDNYFDHYDEEQAKRNILENIKEECLDIIENLI